MTTDDVDKEAAQNQINITDPKTQNSDGLKAYVNGQIQGSNSIDASDSKNESLKESTSRKAS